MGLGWFSMNLVVADSFVTGILCPTRGRVGLGVGTIAWWALLGLRT